MQPSGEVTLPLGHIRGGNKEAMDEVIPLVYRELRAVAGKFFSAERPGHTLQPTAREVQQRTLSSLGVALWLVRVAPRFASLGRLDHAAIH